MSEQNNSGKKPFKKRYKKKPNNNNNKGPKQGANRNKGRNNYNKNRRPKSLTPTKILQKYENLMEQYINARKKYYDVYGRNSTKNLSRMKNNYELALKNLRDFESKLEDWQKEVLDKKINAYKEDREFTQNHGIEPVGDQVSFVGDFEDPHLLATQKEHDWSKDTEESVGTIEDYQRYKESI